MAVYTHVSENEFRALLSDYDIGALIDFSGISEGVENTNYVVQTDAGKFILTLFERRVREEDLPFFVALMEHLSSKDVAAPKPIADRAGALLHQVCERPALITSFLPGKARLRPDAGDCRAFGIALAGLHRAAADFVQTRENSLDLAGWRRLAAQCADRADECAPGLAALIEEELSTLGACWPTGLPEGVVHADLFPDNVFFNGPQVSGFIDFYFSCSDAFAYDLAIAINAWSSVGGDWRDDNASALLDGYTFARPLSKDEKNALPILLRGAALRFLLTRLYDWLNQVEGAVVTVKDPLEYRNILVRHRQRPAAWLFGELDD